MTTGTTTDRDPDWLAAGELDSDRLRRLIEVGRSLVAELELDEVLQRVLTVARELTGARYAALGVLDDDRRQLARFITQGLDDDAERHIGDRPRGHGVLGEIIRHPEPLRLLTVGEHPRSYGFPPHHPPMDTFLGVPIVVRGTGWGNIYLTDKAGGFTAADQQALLVLSDWASIAISNADLYRIQRERRDELERTVAALEATISIARALGAETNIDRVLELVVKRGRALVEARVMVIALHEGGELVVRAVAGLAGDDLLGRRMVLGGELGAGTAVADGDGERIAGQATRLRRALAREVGAETGLVVPLRYRDATVGVLAAFDHMERETGFSGDEEHLLEAFAASAATAVVTAQRVAASTLRRRMEAAEHERARWARELHDESLQDLAGLKILLSSARRGTDVGRVGRLVDEAIDRLSQSIDSLRALIADLRPAALDQLGVAAALDGLAERTRVTHRLDVRLECAIDEKRLAPESDGTDVASTVYRLVQEALTNVVKHSGARSVAVSVLESGDSLQVVVSDDGRGFDPEEPTTGFGLVGMRERVEIARGQLDVEPIPGVGTTVSATIPLPPAVVNAAASA